MKKRNLTILVLLTLAFILAVTACARVDCSIQAAAGGAQACVETKAGR